MAAPQDKLGSPAKNKPGAWVQTERKAHEAWANLIAQKPRAAMLLHHLVAQMGHQNAVVVSQKTLAKLMGIHERTVRRAVADLVEDRWIAVVRIGSGKEAAYVVNDRVAWGQSRDQLRLSVFSATVVADIEDQDPATLAHADLRKIPTLYPGERQLPSGPGAEPPSQPSIEGLEPDLPTISHARVDHETGEVMGLFSDPNFGSPLDGDAADRLELEKRGQQRLLGD
jgi:DNA-binding transcriptional regulator YhcF (GntR family)